MISAVVTWILNDQPTPISIVWLLKSLAQLQRRSDSTVPWTSISLNFKPTWSHIHVFTFCLDIVHFLKDLFDKTLFCTRMFMVKRVLLPSIFPIPDHTVNMSTCSRVDRNDKLLQPIVNDISFDFLIETWVNDEASVSCRCQMHVAIDVH